MFAKSTDALIQRVAEIHKREVSSVNIGFDYGQEFLKILMTVVFKKDPNDEVSFCFLFSTVLVWSKLGRERPS